MSKPDFRVTFEPMGISCGGKADKTLFDIAAEHRILIRSDCGGKGKCGKCLVAAHPKENLTAVTESESKSLSKDQIKAGYRLACQAFPKGPVKISISESELDSSEAIGKTDVGGLFDCNPMVTRLMLKREPLLQKQVNRPQRDFMGSVRGLARDQLGYDHLSFQPGAVRMLSDPSVYGNDITLVNHRRKGITAVLKGHRLRSLGVALDIGTTTLAAYMCDLTSGALLASAATANPQRRFGEDVISRITYANEQADGLSLLQKVVIEEINLLIARCANDADVDSTDIDEVTVVGNTTMEQIFKGIHPHGLGASPYLPVTCAPQDLRAQDLGLNLNPETNVHVFPVISGFVGGDTLGVILSERPQEKDEITLIVDIGTNGELVLGNRQGLWVTSCATGPALEGAHIECGMRAAAGAIHRVAIDSKDFSVRCEVLGNEDVASPKGICGSGIIDAIAGMLRAGVVLESGRINEDIPGVWVDEKGIGRRFILVSADDASPMREIAITLGDIRQIQLAKSALYVGIKLLMQKAGVTRFDRLVLTGAFGARFDWRNAVAIGMLPESVLESEVKVVGNAAGRGAIIALLDREQRKTAEAISQTVNILELAEDPNFVTEFTMATQFSVNKGSHLNY